MYGDKAMISLASAARDDPDSIRMILSLRQKMVMDVDWQRERQAGRGVRSH